MPQLALAFLGAFQVTLAGQPVRQFRVNAARALLAYLAVESDRPQHRETLAGLLWPDVPEPHALNNLRRALFDLRQAIGDSEVAPFLTITRRTIHFHLDQSTWLDVAAFEQGSHASELGALEQAVALYRGPFLAGFSLKESSLFEEWQLLRQQRYAQLAQDALYRLATQCAADGAYQRGQAHVRRLLELEPWDEAAQSLLLRLLTLDGRRSEALAQYEAFRRRLAQELQAEPSAELTSAYDQLRAEQWASTSWASTVQSRALEVTESVTPSCVARERELARLEGWLADALRGHGRVAFITGEAGSGKTALLNEFVRWALSTYDQVGVVGGVCSTHSGQGDPYQPFRDILQRLTGDIEAYRASGVLSPAEAHRLWGILPEALRALVEHGPDLIGSFVDGQTLALRAEAFTSAHAPWRARLTEIIQHAGQSQQPAAVHSQLTAVLVALAQTRPLILIIDDVQWADAETLDLLFHLGRRLSATRLLVLCAHRPGDVAQDGDQRHPLTAVIQEVQRFTGETPINLDKADGRRFIDGLLDATPNRLGADFRQTLYRHTNGHALFTVELLNDLQARGGLVRDETGQLVTGQSLDWARLPARVEAVIAGRISRLSAPQQHLLQAASVEGGEFTAGVVAEAIGWAEDEVVHALSAEAIQPDPLVVATRIDRVGAHRLLRYRFRHALFETYLYQRLDAVTRARWHEAIGTALERRYADQPEAAPRLAQHFEAAGLLLKAAGYWLLAGQRAVRLSAYHEAARSFTHGLTLLAALPQTVERAQVETQLQLALGVALLSKGWGITDRVRVYERVWVLAQQTGAAAEVTQALSALIGVMLGQGEVDRALMLSHELVQLAEQAGQPPLLALAHFAVGTGQVYNGQFEAGRRSLEQALSLLGSLSGEKIISATGVDDGVNTLAWLIPTAWILGDTAGAAAYTDQAMRRARQIDHAFSLGIALLVGVCPYYLWQGQAAETELRQAIDLLLKLGESGWPMFRAWGDVFEGHWRACHGADADSLAQMQRGLATWATTGTRGGYVYQRLLLIEAGLQIGELALARQAAAEALAFIEQSGSRMYEAELHRLRGELAAACGDHAAAKVCFQTALDVAHAQGAMMWARRAVDSLKQLRA